MKPISMPWSAEVKQLRGPLSQAEFAVKIGVSPSTVGYWESGEKEPPERRKRHYRVAAAVPEGGQELFAIPSDLLRQIDELANLKGLDRSAIIENVFRAGLDALSRRPTSDAEVLEKVTKQAREKYADQKQFEQVWSNKSQRKGKKTDPISRRK